MRKSKIATQNEILEFFTDIMRRGGDGDIKLSDAMSAADKLHKYFREKKEEATEKSSMTGIVILPQIKEKEEKE